MFIIGKLVPVLLYIHISNILNVLVYFSRLVWKVMLAVMVLVTTTMKP